MLNVAMNATPARSTSSYLPSVIEIRRLPSQGMRFGSPPKLQGHEMVQLQLSATVAVRCQFGVAARGGTERATSAIAVLANTVRMPERVSELQVSCSSHDDQRRTRRTRSNERTFEILFSSSCTFVFFVSSWSPSSESHQPRRLDGEGAVQQGGESARERIPPVAVDDEQLAAAGVLPAQPDARAEAVGVHVVLHQAADRH